MSWARPGIPNITDSRIAISGSVSPVILNMESSTGMRIESAKTIKRQINLCFLNILTSCLLHMSRRAAMEIIANVPDILFLSCVESIVVFEFPDLKAV
jgi:hypothetical protein